MKFASRLVSFEVAPGDPFRPMATPIYQTATFEQQEATALGPYDYSRSGNPTRAACSLTYSMAPELQRATATRAKFMPSRHKSRNGRSWSIWSRRPIPC